MEELNTASSTKKLIHLPLEGKTGGIGIGGEGEERAIMREKRTQDGLFWFSRCDWRTFTGSFHGSFVKKVPFSAHFLSGAPRLNGRTREGVTTNETRQVGALVKFER